MASLDFKIVFYETVSVHLVRAPSLCRDAPRMKRSSILSQLGWLCRRPSDEAPWLVPGPLQKLGGTTSWLCPVEPVHRTCCTELERFFPYHPSISHGFFSSPAHPVILVYSMVRGIYNCSPKSAHASDSPPYPPSSKA